MTQNTIFAIGIPTINRADILNKNLKRYQQDFPNTKIFIIDNGFQDIEIQDLDPSQFHITANDKNAGVSGSWNMLLENIYNGVPGFSEPCSYALILNDDIYLGSQQSAVNKFIVENLITLATTTGTWCAFILSKFIYRKVGAFDENFYPAYFEDNDYAWRLKLCGYPHTSHEFLDPQDYINSGSIAKDPSLNLNFENNRLHFIRKWGGEPTKETYLVPYGNGAMFETHEKPTIDQIKKSDKKAIKIKNTDQLVSLMPDLSEEQKSHFRVFFTTDPTHSEYVKFSFSARKGIKPVFTHPDGLEIIEYHNINFNN